MLRASLIAFLVLGQGVSSLAGRLTVCLHADGGFCVELPDADCCGHHRVATAKKDDCCGTGDAHRAVGLGARPCDCTHVALLNQPQLTSRVRGDLAASTDQHWLMPLADGHWQLATDALDHSPPPGRSHGGDDVCGALSFLAPVMLRC